MTTLASRFRQRFDGGRCSVTSVALLVSWISLSFPSLPAAAEALPKEVPPFLRKHCSECHADGAAEGGFSVESLLNQPQQAAGPADTRAYEVVYRQLSRGKMPPQDAAQPSAEERSSVVSALKNLLDKVVDDSGNRYAGAFARRLNREELQNDLLDTLGVDRTLYNLPPFVELMPDEGRVDGFDTVGAGLGQSALLLEQYQQFVDRHLALITDDYSPQRWRIKFGSRYTDKERSFYEGLGERIFLYKAEQAEQSVPAFDLTWQLAGRAEPPQRTAEEVNAAVRSFFPNVLATGGDARWGKPGNLELAHLGGPDLISEDSLTVANGIGKKATDWRPPMVSAAGRYKVRIRCRLRFTDGVEPTEVRVRYFNRSHFYAGRFDVRDFEGDGMYEWDEDPPRLCFENPDRSVVLKPGDWVVLEFEDFRPVGEAPAIEKDGLTFDFRFASAAGPKTAKPPLSLPGSKGRPAVFPSREEVEAHYPFLVDVDYLEVEGPYPLVSPSSSLIPNSLANGADARATAKACLAKLLPRLYRGPIAPADLDVLLGVFDRDFSRTNDFRGSLLSAVCAAYLSPRHLFAFNTPADRKPGTPLPPHELATRLSLFLWSSTPDEELRSAADRGELADSAVLKRHVTRLLDHPFASELSANFAYQWLHLYNIGLNEPDTDVYDYDERLRRSMVQESLRFFHEVLRTDGSIRLFLDSDWVMLNGRLASFYGAGKFSGKEAGRPFSSWRKVPIAGQYVPKFGVRGGLLGQASILKLTSSSVRTSIVSRGMFILENILDDPPPPPPENVGEIANAVADLDQKTVREQLEIHRQRASCRSCHQKIDPLGFALENYGAIGQWRTTETDGMKPLLVEESSGDEVVLSAATAKKTKKVQRKGHPVDTKGVVMGVPVDGPRELRALLLTKDDVFARCLVSKLMIYGLGRSLRHQDQAVIDGIVATAAKNGYRLREIIELIVLSDSFRSY
jgi:mono/diheme cytochrome c family protein